MNAATATVVVLKCPQGHSWRIALDATVRAPTDTQVADSAGCCPTCGQPGCSEPIASDVSAAPEKTPALPEVPGYELLGELGRGGMAVVYKARQLQLQRIVALKIMQHPTNGDASWIARFRTEAEAAAQLEHPNIVRMYEVGEAKGLSYLALEFIDGTTLADRAKDEPQNPRWVAALMVQVARAMHYAHERGIVHRDLKPGNILLARSADGTPQPRVADFGLAKRLDRQDGAQTSTGVVMGTPMYMAPEQATGVTRNIGPACDIHALGVILYELLTGWRPYEGLDVIDTLRLVTTEEPVPPRRLLATIPRDLETICLKCLEKRPRQRFATAADLAAELQRFLDGDTILTRPAGPLEKTYKWSRRNPATALAIVVSMVLPLLIAIGLWTHNQRIATELARTAEQRNRAEANLQQTQEAVDKLLQDINGGSLAALPRSAPIRRELLEWAIGLCEQLRVQNPESDALRFQSARAVRQIADLERLLGRWKEAEKHYSQAGTEFSQLNDAKPQDPPVLREQAALWNNFGLLREQLGNTMAAVLSYNNAVVGWESLAVKVPPTAEYQQSHAATLSNLGQLLTQLGDTNEAEKCFAKSLSLHNLASTRVNLGNLQLATGRFSDSQKTFEQALRELTEKRQDQPVNPEIVAALAAVENNLAATFVALQQPQTAEAAYGRAIEQFTPLVRDFPTTLAYREQLATTQLNLAILLLEQRREDDAEQLVKEAKSKFDELAREQPVSPHFRQGVTKSLQQLAAQQAKAGRQTEAELTLLEAITIQQALAKQFPQRAEVLSQLGLLQHAAAKLLIARKGFDSARKYFDQAIESQQQALACNEFAIAYSLRLRDHLRDCADFFIQQGEPAAAARTIIQLANVVLPGEFDQKLAAAQLLAQCLPLAATVKGQEKIDGLTAEEFCRERCLELLQEVVTRDPAKMARLREMPEFSALQDEPRFERLAPRP